ncbi:enoyl-(acyl-carrier-protein) reductase [gamma proteobacterium HTCC5015]|nr:enoyl-(acyl-carrier-protein) reductase [gamma proteobacterium HTCC5015]
MGFLTGKRALITGVASNRSIAWGIAEAMRAQGAEIALTYQNERLKKRVDQCAEAVDSQIVLPCDVSDDESIAALFKQLGEHWESLDIVVHSIGYADRSQIQGDFVDNISRQGFGEAHEISAYSFAALAKAARPMLSDSAALLAMTYLGAERAMPNYNVMGLAKASLEASVRYMAQSLGPQGVRVNAVSAGPIRTLAASGVADFKKMLEQVAETAPLKRNVTTEDVGNTAAFLCSDLARGITSEVIYVDNGFRNVGMGVL